MSPVKKTRKTSLRNSPYADTKTMNEEQPQQAKGPQRPSINSSSSSHAGEDGFTMYPGLEGNPARSKPPLGSYLSWILGGGLFLISFYGFIKSFTEKCEEVYCSLNSVMGMSMAAFGMFLGASLIVIGLWTRSKTLEKQRMSKSELNLWTQSQLKRNNPTTPDFRNN